jgi:hypothetical protein
MFLEFQIKIVKKNLNHFKKIWENFSLNQDLDVASKEN